MYKGFPSSSQTTNEFLSPIFFGHFRVDSLILKPPCKGELPTGSGCLPKKRAQLRVVGFRLFFLAERKKTPFLDSHGQKNMTFFQISLWVVFFQQQSWLVKTMKGLPTSNFFSSHNMLSFQKEMHKKLSCSAQLTSTLFCHVSCLKSGIRFSSIVLDFFCLNFLGVSKFFHQLEGCELTNL